VYHAARQCVRWAEPREMQCFNCRGVRGLNPPSCLLNPPNKMPWDTLGGQFQPPAVVNDAESPVCNDNDNE
jgi:hypothetical protein